MIEKVNLYLRGILETDSDRNRCFFLEILTRSSLKYWSWDRPELTLHHYFKAVKRYLILVKRSYLDLVISKFLEKQTRSPSKITVFFCSGWNIGLRCVGRLRARLSQWTGTKYSILFCYLTLILVHPYIISIDFNVNDL